ncbi:hypothetical protein ACT29H_15245 [Thermophagus sp. OGC60D27]|uniref:hypothetical protein n=1 Tax=Thermophagus sp. OGC60D27 TaxID=3458415 RepID=UPI0040377562
MKNHLLLILTLLFSLNSFSQDENIQAKLDSILKEADLIYNYEKSVWNSSDLLLTNKKIKKNYGGYIVCHSNDTLTVTYLDKKQKESIARYRYKFDNLDKPLISRMELSSLTALEKELFESKKKIMSQLSDSKYNVTVPRGYNPNFVLIKENEGYKLYIIMGTTEIGVIPIGNDYLFKANSEGDITYWKKFHSRMIPTMAEFNGENVISSFHSHLRTTPYITATDICTFRLYAQFTELRKFSVYSPAIGKTMTYYLDSNKIEIEE